MKVCLERVVCGVLLLGALTGCGSAPPKQASSPDPSLEEPASAPPVAAASSAKVQQGLDAIQQQNFAAAKAVLLQARSEAPKDPQAAFYLGVAHEGLEEFKAAEQQYRDALQLDPKLSDASANLSALLLDAANGKEALSVIEQGLETSPKHPELLVNRALALETAGDIDGAVKAYAVAVRVRPQDPELRLAYADLLLQSGQTDRALEQVRAGSETDDPKLLAAVAHRFGKLKAPAECVAVLDRAIKAKPVAELYARRGVCRHDAGDDAGAQADYEAALKLEPDSAPAHFYLGKHLMAKDKKAAAKHLNKVVELTGGKGLGAAAKAALTDLGKNKK